MPPRKRQLSPDAQSEVAPPLKKAKPNATPSLPTAILSPTADVVNEEASDGASTLSGEGAPPVNVSASPPPSAVAPTSSNSAAGGAANLDSSNLATPSEQDGSPSSESHTATTDEGPVLPGALTLRPGRMWKPDLIDQSLDVALKLYLRPNDYVEEDEINWQSTNGNVAPVSFSNLSKLASVDLTFLHKLLALVNHQTWKHKSRTIHNPLFADPNSFTFKGDYNHVNEDKVIAHFGLVCLVSTSAISQRDGVVSLAPLRQMWLALGRFLATLGGEVGIGFQTSDGDLTMTRPPFTNGGGSPVKAGRDPPPDSSPSIMVHDLTSRTSDSFNVSEFKARYGDFKSNEVAFVTFTARKWDQDAKTLWLFTPVRFISLSG